jgi:hypothetical protein
MMKPTAILLNISRIPVADEPPLAEALERRVIAGTGLDVYENEPRVDPLLLKLENVVLAPHIASASVDTRRKMSMMAAENAVAGVERRRPPNLPNPELWDSRAGLSLPRCAGIALDHRLLEVDGGMADGHRRAYPCPGRGRGPPGNRSYTSSGGAIPRTDRYVAADELNCIRHIWAKVECSGVQDDGIALCDPETPVEVFGGARVVVLDDFHPTDARDIGVETVRQRNGIRRETDDQSACRNAGAIGVIDGIAGEARPFVIAASIDWRQGAKSRD